MKRLALRALYATLFAGGLTLLGAGVAHASETSGDDGILSGSQVGISIELPVTLSGNAISVIGDSQSSDATTEVATGGGDADPRRHAGAHRRLGAGDDQRERDLRHRRQLDERRLDDGRPGRAGRGIRRGFGDDER